LLVSINMEGRGPALAVEGAITAAVSEIYIEGVLAPKLQQGQLVVMDNLSAHKGERIRKLVEARGCELVYVPSYSSDLDPIEEAFSKIKGILRKAQARSVEALIEAMGRALGATSRAEMRKASSSPADTGHWVNCCNRRPSCQERHRGKDKVILLRRTMKRPTPSPHLRQWKR
jgi:transposase